MRSWMCYEIGYNYVQVCSGDGDGSYTPPPSTTPGPAGSSGGFTGTKREVVNNTVSPCFKNAVDLTLASNVDIKNEMSTILTKLGEPNNGIVITIQQDDALEHNNVTPKPGETSAIRVDQANNFTVTIKLNGRYFEGTSVESVAANLIHEFVHAYIGFKADPLLTQSQSVGNQICVAHGRFSCNQI